MGEMSMGAGEMHVSYDLHTIALSLLVACVSAYVALSLAERITENRGLLRAFWLIGGATAMGTGIWAMHFIGMLAYHLPVPISYDIPTVVLSFLVAILASAIALGVVSRPEMSQRELFVGGLLMGSGITAMHYIGMAAMRIPATVQWDAGLIVISALIAVVVSLVALTLVFRLRAASEGRLAWRRVAAAAVMGIAVAGMHYTGMAAAEFTAKPGPLPSANVVSAAHLGVGAIVLVTFFVLISSLAVAYLDRRFVAHEFALSETQSRFHAIVANSPVVLFALDAEGTITMAQGRDLSRVHCDAANALGRSFFEVFSELPIWLSQARRALAGEEFTGVDHAFGSVIEMRWMPVRDTDGAVAGLIAVGTDITERRHAEEALRHQSFHDDLTGLPNRTALNKHLALCVEWAHAHHTPLTLALLDLNRFKIINDSLGHEVGDLLLQKISGRICKTIRESDFAARIGGDEFAVIIPGTNGEESEELAARILAVLKVPFEINGHTLEVGAAVGLAMYPTHALDATTLLRYADVAMYVAKRAGTDVLMYDILHDQYSAARLMMENGLRHAIATDELVLHYQPTIELATGAVKHVEALVRWQHPVLGQFSPDQFIPMAEETGLIVPLTRWVLDAALRQSRLWRENGIDVGMSVNLSARSLLDAALPKIVADQLEQHAVPPGRLTLEITETALMADMDATRVILNQLSALGVMISIDDFGTGYSSLAYLAQLPVDELKIDRAFVMAMHANAKDASIVRWINGLGHVLGLRVVAEGVETIEALETLRVLECDCAQGYYISRPLPAGELEAWLKSSLWSVGHDRRSSNTRNATQTVRLVQDRNVP